jgi:hypothetical protein
MRIWGRNGHLRPLKQIMKHEEYGWPVEEGWGKVSAEEVLKVKHRNGIFYAVGLSVRVITPFAQRSVPVRSIPVPSHVF